MSFQHLAAMALSLAAILPSSALAQAPEPKPATGANAALKYWQAFGLLPKLDMEQERILQDWNKTPLDDAAQKLLDRSRGSREYLHRGAKLLHCDWSLDYEDGIFLLIPHLSKARTLARLAALHARHEFAQGHWQAGWEDVSALLKLARHLEVEPLMIVQLVGYSIEAMAFETAAVHLPELNARLPRTAFAVLDGRPGAPTLSQLVLKEKEVSAIWLMQALKKAERTQEGAWQRVWKQAFGAPTESDVGWNLVNSAKTHAQADKLLSDLLPFFDELAKVAALPWKEFDAQYPKFAKNVKEANPLAGFIMNMEHAMASYRRIQAQRALFKAALAFAQGGKAKLDEVRDPFGDGPFAYRALDKGFELRSAFRFRGEPVTLIVGKK